MESGPCGGVGTVGHLPLSLTSSRARSSASHLAQASRGFERGRSEELTGHVVERVEGDDRVERLRREFERREVRLDELGIGNGCLARRTCYRDTSTPVS